MDTLEQINNQMMRGTKAEAVNLMARALVMAAGGSVYVSNRTVERSNDILLETVQDSRGTLYKATWKPQPVEADFATMKLAKTPAKRLPGESE